MLRYLRQLSIESAVYGLAAVVSRFLAIFLVPLYTRIFVPEDFGILSLVTATMTVVAILVLLGLDTAAARWYYDTEDATDRKRTFATWTWCQLALSFGCTGIMVVFSAPLAAATTGRVSAAPYLALAALSLPASSLTAVVTNWLRCQRRPWATTAFTLGTNALGMLLVVLLVVVLRRGLAGVYLGQLGGALVGSAGAVALMRDWMSLRHFRWRRLHDMLGYSLPLLPASVAFWVVSFSDRFFVQFYTTTAQVGLYQMGSYLAAGVALVTGAFQLAYGPFALSIHTRPESRRVYANVLLAYTCLTCVISAGLSMLAPEILRLLTTRAYADSAPVVAYLAFSYVMIGMVYIATVGPAIVKTTRPTAVAMTLGALLNVALNIALVPHLGKVGAAVATLISQSLVPAYVFFRAQRLYPIPYRFGPVMGMLTFSLALAVTGSSWRLSNAWLGGALKVTLLALFIPLLFALKVTTVEQVRRMLGVRTAPRLQNAGARQ